jgi:hypothetical protein
MTERGSERVEVLHVGKSENFLNLSVTGAGFISSQPLSKNSRVTISINAMRLHGYVVYCKKRNEGFRIGVKFNSMAPEVQSEVGKMVESFSCGVPLKISIETVAAQ